MPAEAKNLEVDFLLKRGAEMLAVEAKASSRLREDHLRGLMAVEGVKGMKRRVLIYLGNAQLRTEDGIEVWPFDLFSDRLLDGKF